MNSDLMLLVRQN